MKIFLFSSSDYKDMNLKKYACVENEDCTILYDGAADFLIEQLIDSADLVILFWNGTS